MAKPPGRPLRLRPFRIETVPVTNAHFAAFVAATGYATVAEDQKVMKGGSFLCHESYCDRYRIVARSGAAADSGASNSGFRLVCDAG